MRALLFLLIFISANCFGQQPKDLKPPEPITIVQPTITTKTIPPDSSTFSITIKRSEFLVSVRRESQTLKTSKEVDKFLTTQKSIIDPTKILIISDRTMPYERFKLIIDVLKKHGFTKFEMVNR